MVKEDATDEEIREVLEMACAYDFVKKLPKGMETVVGEKGSGLSEGQAQRLGHSEGTPEKCAGSDFG